jgi:hypothetical protein
MEEFAKVNVQSEKSLDGGGAPVAAVLIVEGEFIAIDEGNKCSFTLGDRSCGAFLALGDANNSRRSQLDKPSSSNCHCLVNENSDQPAAKSAFMSKGWRVLRGSDSTILDSLFRAFIALKNSTG